MIFTIRVYKLLIARVDHSQEWKDLHLIVFELAEALLVDIRFSNKIHFCFINILLFMTGNRTTASLKLQKIKYKIYASSCHSKS